MTKYQFLGARDEPLVRFEKMRGMLHRSCKVVIEPAAAQLLELPWIVALGWYLVIKMQDDSTAAAAAG